MTGGLLGLPVAVVSTSGLVQPKAEGHAALQVSVGGQSATVPVTVAGLALHTDTAADAGEEVPLEPTR